MSGRVDFPAYQQIQQYSQKSMEILKVLTSVHFFNPTLTSLD